VQTAFGETGASAQPALASANRQSTTVRCCIRPLHDARPGAG
jgi:hypothetical protein